MNRQRALDSIFLKPTDRIPHWESLSNPAFEQRLTGIDPWGHPRLARERMLELIPQDVGSVPISDEPLERASDGQLTSVDSNGDTRARWGAGLTERWDHGKEFKTLDDVLAYDPAEHMDMSHSNIVGCEGIDFTLGIDELASQRQLAIDGMRAATGERSLCMSGFYNTLFMWPMVTFGWELFLETGAAYPDEMKRLLAGFAERSRKIFQAIARTDIEVVTSHDDICYAAGPVFSPTWLREFIYPYYEEFWGYLKAAGKKVIFICDGDVTQVADDIFACGADGIRSEPFTNWRQIAAKHPDKVLVGDGDNRVLATNDREAIEHMVRDMTEWGKRCVGYFLCCGNHLPWNLPPEAIEHYFRASERYGQRK